MSGRLLCKQPDRDVPKIECGHPLPCPYHTLVIEADSMEQAVDKVVSVVDTLRKLRQRQENNR